MLKFADLKKDQLSPLMQQYLEVKLAYPDCLIFCRLGDFYELFFDDALVAVKELELALTGRDCGLEERAPMCGVPHHAADSYILRLVSRGYKIAIFEQVEDPAKAVGLVKREVVKLITPGTLTDQGYLDEQKYSFLASVFQQDNAYGLAVCDITTGLFACCEIVYGAAELKLVDELAKYQPAEIVCNRAFAESSTCHNLQKQYQVTLSLQDDNSFGPTGIAQYADKIDLHKDFSLWAGAAAGLLKYIEETQFHLPEEITAIKPYQINQYMVLDLMARRNLELTESLRDRKRKGSLLWAVDRTVTAMGARLLRLWLEEPLLDLEAIQERQNAISELYDHFIERQTLIESLKGIYDLERLTGRLSLGQVNARDLVALVGVLTKLAPLKGAIQSFKDPYLVALEGQLKVLGDLGDLLKRAISDDPPSSLKEGGLIKPGFNDLVDRYRDAAVNGKNWILNLEKEEREKTGIKSLKLGYNRVFGYYIDVRKTNLNLVPDYYIRRQTLTNSERYVTEELKQMEDQILGAEQKLISLEYDLFTEIRDKTSSYVADLRLNAQVIAQLDVLSSLAQLAEMENYCKPEVTLGSELAISQGRHPVVEQTLAKDSFVANDVLLNDKDKKVMILTGPNMSGKSTYMRQVALIVLLAQVGSFVPAMSAKIGIADRIFTRVGAADDLASGQSTFMVEMNEVAQIMRNAGPRSLLILDEIGRGTSTYDGLSIAWSVIEHIVDPNYINARTLFATHYHELTDLADATKGVFNCHITTAEEKGKIVFLHHIEEGCAGQSYGIEVAQLAGVPDSIVSRAREILYQLEKDNQGKRLTVKKTARLLDGEVDLFSAAQKFKQTNKVIDHLVNIDMDYVSPVDARKILLDLIQEAKGKN